MEIYVSSIHFSWEGTVYWGSKDWSCHGTSSRCWDAQDGHQNWKNQMEIYLSSIHLSSISLLLLMSLMMMMNSGRSMSEDTALRYLQMLSMNLLVDGKSSLLIVFLLWTSLQDRLLVMRPKFGLPRQLYLLLISLPSTRFSIASASLTGPPLFMGLVSRLNWLVWSTR